MPDDSWGSLVHFKELHLLPRVVFSMGAVIFVASLIARDLELALFGAGAVFAGVAFNFFVVIFRIGYEGQDRWLRIGGLGFDLLLAAVIAIICFYVSAHLSSCDSIPTYFKPQAPLTK